MEMTDESIPEEERFWRPIDDAAKAMGRMMDVPEMDPDDRMDLMSDCYQTSRGKWVER